MSSNQRQIVHNIDKSRFEYTEDGQLCVLDYILNNSIAAFTHTGVPSAVGGRGIAADLVRFGLDTAKSKGWQVRPDCSYVAAFIQRNPEYQELTVS